MLTGEVGLDREVEWPAMLRSRAPAFAALTGGEFALVSAEAIRLIDALAERGVAAVAVLGPVDPEAVATAIVRELPLVRLPEGANLHDLEQDLSRVINQQRAAIYSLGLELQRQLADLSMLGRGMGALLTCLAEATNCIAALVQPGPTIVEVATPPDYRLGNDDLVGFLADVDRRGVLLPLHMMSYGAEPPITRQRLGEYAVLVAPMVFRGTPGAGAMSAMVLVGPANAVDDAQRAALGRARVVCAMELAKQEAVVEAEQRLRGDLIAELLDNPAPDEQQLLPRAQRLGYDLRRHAVVLVARATDHDESSPRTGSLVPALRLARERRPDAPVAIRDESLIIVIPLADPQNLQSARSLADALLRETGIGGRIALGLGRAQHGLAGIQASFREAEQALVIGRQIFGAGRLSVFQDLGSYRLLFQLAHSPELRAFHDETLGTLLEYDAQHGTELVRTLEAYFAHGANLKDTAEALSLHRNSLAYRLRRIVELTGYNLDDFEDRFRLQLAFKARQLLALRNERTDAISRAP